MPFNGRLTPPMVLHVTTVGMTLLFLRGHAAFMRARGIKLAVASSPDLHQAAFAAGEQVVTCGVPMERRISPRRDLVAVFRLIRAMRTLKPDIVHAHTPKAGLIAMIAAMFCSVPVRIYHLHGLPMSTARGVKKFILRSCEQLSCVLAHQVLCVSRSLKDATTSSGVSSGAKVAIVGEGSIGGVDAERRFNPQTVGAEARLQVRKAYGIPEEAIVVGFVGRLVPDKGIAELLEAHRELSQSHRNAHLLVVGPFEHTPLDAETRLALTSDRRIHLIGEDWDTPRLLAAMDIFCLPSYREGFPVVCLEAAAMALPIVATRVTGCMDAVLDGVTGTLVAPRDARALADALRVYCSYAELRQQHGRAGRERVCNDFTPERIWSGMLDIYARLLQGADANATFYRRIGKRSLDIAMAGTLLFLCAPLMAGIALALLVTGGGPILFRQWRPGYLGRPFQLVKFRTMLVADGTPGTQLPDRERLTRFGRILRSTSLDELPELLNVLRGDMSLVGPRPLLMQYLDRYSPEQSRRHEVRPGITGMAQVNGRNALSWEQKFGLDVDYVDRCSLLLDLKILIRTVWQVLAQRNINQAGQATAQEFMGTPSA